MKLILLATALALTALTSAPAHAWDLGVVAGLNIGNSKTDIAGTSVESSAQTSYAAGATFNTSLLPMISLEADLLLERTKYKGATNSTSLTSFNIPVMLRYHFVPLFSLGAGPFFRFFNGDVTTTNIASGVETKSTYESNSMSKSDFGAVLSAALRLPLSPGLGLVGDARYYWGFKNLYTGPLTTVTAKSTGFQLLAGVEFSF